MLSTNRSIIGALLLLILPVFLPALHAQPGDGGTTAGSRALIDGVAAVAGNEIILMSDVVQRSALVARNAGGQVPASDPQLQQKVLNDLIDEKLVLTRAREDSITVSEEMVTQKVEFTIDGLIRQFGSVAEVEKAYGMSIDRIRQEAREIMRQQLLTQKAVQEHFRGMKVTDRDIQEVYNLYKDSLGMVPEQVELQQIVLIARPSRDAKAASRALLMAIRDSIANGGDFADFARRYSADAVSAKNGGDVGYVGPGRFVASYEKATKVLGINEISEPVESPYGYHLIQVLDKRGNEVRSRHILLRIEATPHERDSLLALARDIRARALAGESFADLAQKYSADKETAVGGGVIGRAAMDELPPEMKELVSKMKEGDITEPIQTMVSQTETGYRMIRYARRIPAHAYDPVEDRSRLEQIAGNYKQRREYSEWIAELRRDIYWEIKTDM
jgi:peptidyl-prolyl cis-trans isomerase SurA